MEEVDIDHFELRVEHLLKISTLLSSKIDPSENLKKHYLLKCKELLNENKFLLPAKFMKDTYMCKNCTNIWKEGNYKVLINHKNPGHKIKGLLKKHNENKLSKYNRNLLKKIKSSSPNQLIIICSFCKKKSKIPCLKNFTLQMDKSISNSNSTNKKNKFKNQYDLNIKTPKRNNPNTSNISINTITPKSAESDKQTVFDRKQNFHSKYKNKIIEKKKQIKNEKTPKKSSTPKRFIKCNKLKQLLNSSETPQNSKNSLKAFLGSL